MIINNLSRLNHFHYLKEIFGEATDITIISPYITTDHDLFPFDDLGKLKRVTIVTTVKKNDRDQYSKIAYFKYLFMAFNRRNIHFKIIVENTLHAKVFIAKQSNDIMKAIITSANFTHNGLKMNNEWGYMITSAEDIEKLEKGIINKAEFEELDENCIDECLRMIEQTPLPPNHNTQLDLDLSILFKLKQTFYQLTEKTNFWLKPIGVSSDIIPRTRLYDEMDIDLHFSKLKPKGVRPGDILICYAVGHLNILSIYVVKSEIKNSGIQNDRWPYYVIGENLTPNYGRVWHEKNITVTNQKQEALDLNQWNLTPSGKNSYGSLMRGADKLRLTNEFGNFILTKLSKINSELAD